MIPDPFFGLNESQLQWISNKSWTYRLAFQPSSKVFSKKNIEILFHGLDTYADVFLNGTTVICANNMFHPWSAEIKDIISAEDNELLVQFRSPLKEVIEKMVQALNEHRIDNIGDFFENNFNWFGNFGCGTKIGLKEFQQNWQVPFQKAFSENVKSTD